MILNQVRAEKHLTRNTEVPNLNSESMWMPTNLKNVKASFVNPPIKQTNIKSKVLTFSFLVEEPKVDEAKRLNLRANNFYTRVVHYINPDVSIIIMFYQRKKYKCG